MKRYVDPDAQGRKRCAAQTRGAETDGEMVNGEWVPNSQCMRAAVDGLYCKQHAVIRRAALRRQGARNAD